MSLRQFIGAVGVLLALAALIALLVPMTATTTGVLGFEQTADCGSSLLGNPSAPSPPECDEKTGDLRLWALPLGAVGLIAVLGAMVVETPGRRPEHEPEDSEAS